jgi:NifU-like protein involved in Fe-S cluster formation
MLRDLQKMSDEELLKDGVGFEVNPGRIKCLMLPVKVVRKLLAHTPKI